MGLELAWNARWHHFVLVERRGREWFSHFAFKNWTKMVPHPLTADLFWLLRMAWDRHGRRTKRNMAEAMAQLARDEERRRAKELYEQNAAQAEFMADYLVRRNRLDGSPVSVMGRHPRSTHGVDRVDN
ncbi:MAG: hypothetical protein ABII82_00340 [Verrucomicrobiota bacterium]